MTLALTIATPFADFSELSDNFAQRVDAERLMLPYAEPVAEGEWVSFTVTYADGSTALSGAGRCQGSYDNGEEHPPEYRYDVVVDSLQIEGAGEVMFERLVMARNSQMGEPNAEPATGEVAIDELEAAHAASVAAAEPAAEDAVEDAVDDVAGGWDEPQPTAIANLDSLAASSTRSEPPPAPSERPAPRAAPAAAASPSRGGAAARPRPGRASAPAALPSPHTFNGTVLTRPTQPAAWSPEPAERPASASSSGLFDYGRGGLPKPARPPRPDLAPEARVELAPGPGRPARRAAPASIQPGGQTVPPASEELDAHEASADSTTQYELPVDEDA
jgi:hypothetical protein